MSRLLLLLAIVATQASASSTPVSGVFSNASKDALDGTFNMVVVANERGQQFSIQCFKNGRAGFATLTHLAKPRVKAVIRADASCAAKQIEVELDYEEAYVRFGGKRVVLPRSGIYIPIID